jgi:hypothetical protein
MMFVFGKPVAEPSSNPGEVAMAQREAPSPTLPPLITRYSFAVLPIANRTRFIAFSKMMLGR